MLTIEHNDVVEDIKIGQLFSDLGFTEDSDCDANGDSLIENTWPIEVLSLDAFYPIEGFRWTKPERQVTLTINNVQLLCSPEHLVLQQEPNEWIKVGNLQPGDKVVTKNGVEIVNSVEQNDESEIRLCDLQVAIAHSYFANDILSHNSHWLTYVGANALKAGHDVLHYTMELSETQVGVRYDSNLCDINSSHIIENKDKVLERYKDQKLGRLFIKQYPMNSATIYTIKSHVERLSITKGFRPKLILIDYADIMRSTRQYDSLRHELKLVYEELRSFAVEMGFPIWTASQSNKEGSSSDIVDLSNMSEAYGKAMVADTVISLSRKAHEKSSGFGRLFVAKNRAGCDGILYPIKIDTSKSNFEVIGGPGNFSEEKLTDEAELKRDIARRLHNIKKDPEIPTKPAS